MKYLYILKVGTTFPNIKEKYYDFDDWISRFFKNKRTKIKVIDILKEEKLPSFKSSCGFIITGSHCMVTDELKWSLKLEKYVRNIAKTNIPLLGICYGHQLIAKALGGKSHFNPKGKEIGVVTITKHCNGYFDPLLKDFPKKFYAYETHYQTVLKIPTGSKILAMNNKDNHQTVRYTKNIWGVQFHPEFDKRIMEEYILNQKDDLEKLHFNVNTLLSAVKSCDVSSKILTNFWKIINPTII